MISMQMAVCWDVTLCILKMYEDGGSNLLWRWSIYFHYGALQTAVMLD